MKKAIFLRGAVRTWNFTKDKIIQFYNELFDYPDWYVCFWKSSTTTIESLRQDFSNSNLICLELENDTTFNNFKFNTFSFGSPYSNIFYPCKNYWKLAYLDNILSISKRNYEIRSKVEYQLIIFLRSDILPKMYDNSRKEEVIQFDDLGEMEILNQKVINVHIKDLICPKINPSTMENYFVGDATWLAGAHAADLYGTRFFDTEYTDGSLPQNICWDVHTKMALIQSTNQLHYNNTIASPIDFAYSLVRPNDVDSIEKATFNPNRWAVLSHDEKLWWCDYTKIDISDYDLKRDG